MHQETIDDVNEVIKLLGDVANKIPQNVIDFFDNYS